MKNNFLKALNWIFKAEGGQSDDPIDKGGATKYGISLRFLKQQENGDINNDGAIDKLDINALTKADAEAYYRADFWDVCGCSHYPLPLAIIIFDQAVNTGARTTARLLQRHVGAKVDGIIGPITTAKAIAKYEHDPSWFIASYLSRRAVYYRDIVLKDPLAEYFLKGWLNRLFLLQQYLQENN